MDKLPAIIRPNGKIYQPRKVRGILLDGPELNGPESCLIAGTHDIERARKFAVRLIKEYDSYWTAGDAVLTWQRPVIRNYDRSYEYDTVRGAAGVMFEMIEEYSWAG